MDDPSSATVLHPSILATREPPAERTSQYAGRHRIVVVGAGVAGLSVSIWLRRFGLTPLVFEQTIAVGGMLRSIGNQIPDYPGIPTISGAALADRIARHARSVDVKIQRAITVYAISPAQSQVETSAGPIRYDGLIIATGSRNRQLEVPGEREMIERQELPSADTDAVAFQGRSVAMVGGGDRALEEALILADAGAHVVLIHRSIHFRAQRRFIAAVRRHPRIDVMAPGQVTRIVGTGRVTGIEVSHAGTTSAIACCAVFVRIGVVGNADFVADAVDRDSDGFIIADAACHTSRSGVWAIGDIAAPAAIRSISTATGQAALVAKQLSLGRARHNLVAHAGRSAPTFTSRQPEMDEHYGGHCDS